MKICVDPGHGMSNRSPGIFDPGTTHTEAGTLFREADIVLRYGLTLKDVLRARGIDVFMTRDDNNDVAPVGARAEAARNAGCGCFISFHINSVEDEQANGTETLYRDDADIQFAQRIQNAVVGALGLRDRGLKQRSDLAVLRFQGTAVLIELGFIGNDRDRNRVLEPQVRAAVCEVIAGAIGAHFNLPTSSITSRSRIEPVAAFSARAEFDGNEESGEHDPVDMAGYDIQAPLILGAERLTQQSFRATFGDEGVRDNFNIAAFEEKVAGWGLRHFSAAELLYLGGSHYGNGRCAGRNSLPPQRLWESIRKTALMIDEVREQFGHPIRITSGYRDADYNRCVGGETNSYHMRYNALDFTNVDGTLREMYAIALRIRNQNREFAGGIGYYPGQRFVHIDTRGENADW